MSDAASLQNAPDDDEVRGRVARYLIDSALAHRTPLLMPLYGHVADVGGGVRVRLLPSADTDGAAPSATLPVVAVSPIDQRLTIEVARADALLDDADADAGADKDDDAPAVQPPYPLLESVWRRRLLLDALRACADASSRWSPT